MHRAVVALKVRVVQLVEVVAGSWPLEAIVTEPRTDSTVDHAAKEDGRVRAEGHRDQCGAKVHERFHWMHVGTREGGWVVRLVVQRMDMFVEESPNIRDPTLVVLFKPRVHATVDRPKVWDAPVRHCHGPHNIVEENAGRRGNLWSGV